MTYLDPYSSTIHLQTIDLNQYIYIYIYTEAQLQITNKNVISLTWIQMFDGYSMNRCKVRT